MNWTQSQPKPRKFCTNHFWAALAILGLLVFLVALGLLVDSIRQQRQILIQYQHYAERPASSSEYNRLNEEGQAVYDLVTQRSNITSGALFIALFCFIAWFRNAYLNLETFGHLNFNASACGVVWSCLVPGLNLVRPYLLMLETWRGSSLEAINSGPNWRRLGTSPLIHLSWFAQVFGWIGGRILMQFQPTGQTLNSVDSYIYNRTAVSLALMMVIIGQLLAILLVIQLTLRQRATARRISGLDANEQEANGTPIGAP